MKIRNLPINVRAELYAAKLPQETLDNIHKALDNASVPQWYDTSVICSIMDHSPYGQKPVPEEVANSLREAKQTQWTAATRFRNACFAAARTLTGETPNG